MVNIKIILVIGLIGSGKSQVCKQLQKKGAHYLSCDKIVADLYAIDKVLEQNLVKIFGQEILECGKICKAKLASLVFKDKKQLFSLEKIIHPLVEKKLRQAIQEINLLKKSLLIIEMPAIKNTILASLPPFKIIFVLAKKAIRLQRWIQQGHSKEDFLIREDHQNEKDFLQKADFIIENDTNLFDLEQKISKIHEQINTI